MGDLRIGTSGYDYQDWQKVFYPEGTARKQFLEYYCSQFSTLELNFSYYRMPGKKQLQSMVDRSEGRIDFSIKAHESLTHKIDPATWKQSVDEYISSVSPLMEANALAAVLLQFPYSFHYKPENRQYLDKLIKEMNELPLVVEFRNSKWLNNRVFDALRERDVGYCCVDAPQLRGIPPALDVVTSGIGYIRFHGRNEKDWWGSDAAARFDYLYSQEELKSWMARIRTMLAGCEKVRVFFNNHRRGQAPQNAKMLQSLLDN